MLALSGTAYVFGQAPVANFRASVNSGCGPLSVTFTDLSTGNPTEWNWEFSNGTLSSVKNPTVSFAAAGTYSVKLIVRNADGLDEEEKIDFIIVFPSPIADFAANLTLACVPATVQFTDHSSTTVGNITKWEWDFGDGTTSGQPSPSHVYANPGFYTVALRVTSSTGCVRRISRTRYIRVVDGVNTDFTFSQAGSCRAPFTVNFQNQSSGPGTISYNWNFGNGQTSTATNPVAIFNAPGTYTVRLNSRSNLGCTGDTVKTITLTQTTTDFTAPTTVCLDQPVAFQNNSSDFPNLASWDFGDGTTSAQVNPIKTFLTPGVYTVRLINRYDNCTDSAKKTITVIDKPVVDFQVNADSSCKVPFNVQFTANTPGATSWVWDFGDGNTSSQQNPTHTYTTLGNFTVTLTASTSTDCSETNTKTDFIKIQETTVDFNVGRGCVPFTYEPVATVETLDPIVSYLWTFGDGATSTQQNPSHIYATAGVFEVTLTVTTASGCTQKITKADGVRTGTPPVANFTVNPLAGCASQEFEFTGTATTTPGALVVWSWDFGDETGGSGQITRHVFQDTGSVVVRLTVSNNGCDDFYAQAVQVNPPKAKFTDTVINCNTHTVRFINESLVNPALSPTSYSWEMGDPANTKFTTRDIAPFNYPGPGTYNVKLKIVNGSCTDSSIHVIKIVDEKADFSISKNPVCIRTRFGLSAINSNADNISEYSWMIGTRIVGNERTISPLISAPGSYAVTLTITDINGCKNTKTVPNFIQAAGSVARFTPATPGACMNKTMTFTDQSTSSSSIVKWDWNFGDGTKQSFTAPPFTHTYARTGRFGVSLTITDANGCTATDSLLTLLRVTNPQIGFRADTFYCPAAPLQFTDTSSGAGLTYLWTFGDGTTSTVQNPKHNYPLADADYSVKLKITDVSGCQDSVTKTNYIKIRSPKAAFDIKDTATFCPPLRTTFTFKGSDYKSYYWDFGDGGRSGLLNPAYFYGDYGRFTPKLYVLGTGGCIDSAEATVSVYNPDLATQLNYTVPPSPICNSVNIDFNLVVPTAFKFILHFGDGAADSSQQRAVRHFYSRPGFYSPRVELYDTTSGCQVTIPGRQRVNVLGAVPLFGKDKKEFCDRGTVTFKNFTTKNDPIISNVWSFGDNSTATDLNPSHTYTQPGTYIITLTVTTQNNCTKSFSDTIRVYRTPNPFIDSRDTICVNQAYPFEGVLETADTAITWQWNYGNGQTSTQQNNNFAYTTAGNYTVTLTAKNKIGCSSDTTKNIYVTPLPTAEPVQNPLTIPAGSGANILMNYTGNIVSYNWIPTMRLSCTSCPSPYANPQFTTKYSVQLEDRYGCKGSGDITVVVVCGKDNYFIPNTFSPNGDGRNEVFYPKGTGLYRIKSMRVFNRWGEIMFEKNDFAANDPSVGWNGTYKGKPASPDAYIYTMEILCENNVVIPVKGNVTLLR